MHMQSRKELQFDLNDITIDNKICTSDVLIRNELQSASKWNTIDFYTTYKQSREKLQSASKDTQIDNGVCTRHM